METQEPLAEGSLALVYRGPAGCPGCSEAVARLLQSSRWRFRVQYVGPGERLPLAPEILRSAFLYAQPGGSGELSQAYRRVKPYANMLRNYVAAGGRYLGFCMGGYLAGRTPGFHLLPGDTDQYITSPGASVKSTADTLIRVQWRGQERVLYFQDGPFFSLDPHTTGVSILATYTNGTIAALIASYGKGSVCVCGPHPEASEEWYEAAHLVHPEGIKADSGHDLIDALVAYR